jgi:glycosyltransferase involved in cell wall biosynthesis
MNYLMVLPVLFYRISEDVFATESAFCEHLRLLKRSLGPGFRQLTIAAPQMTRAVFLQRRNYLAEIDGPKEGIQYVPLEPGGVSRLAYWFKHVLRSARILWHEVGRACVIHAGPSLMLYPRENLSILFGIIRRRKTIFVVDIDWRRSAWMNYKTGAWSGKSYWLAKTIYDPVFSLQVWLACRFCSLVLLKSGKLVRDYGGGRPQVKDILDAAHSSEHIISEPRFSAKMARLRSRSAPLKLVYFGRLTRYKGIDKSMEAIARIQMQGGPRISLQIIGVGEEEHKLRTQAIGAGIQDLVTFHGPIPFGVQLFQELINYDLLLATPLAADTPRNALDAMACGIPIVAFDIDYYVDLRERSGAVALVPWLDAEALVIQILALDRDRDELAKMAQLGRNFAKENTQEVWLDRRAAWTRAYCTAADLS